MLKRSKGRKISPGHNAAGGNQPSGGQPPAEKWGLSSTLTSSKARRCNPDFGENAPSSLLVFVFPRYCSVASRCLEGPQPLERNLSSSVGEQVSNFTSWKEVLSVFVLHFKTMQKTWPLRVCPSDPQCAHDLDYFCPWLAHTSLIKPIPLRESSR